MNNNRLDNYTKEDLVKYGEEFVNDLGRLMYAITCSLQEGELETNSPTREALHVILCELNKIMQNNKLPFVVLDNKKIEGLTEMRVVFNDLEKAVSDKEE